MSELKATLGGAVQLDAALSAGTTLGGAVAFPPVGGDKTHVHTQAEPAAEWTVHHNLSKKPSITVVDSADTVVIGEVEYIDTNTVRLKFIGAFAGRAYCN